MKEKWVTVHRSSVSIWEISNLGRIKRNGNLRDYSNVTTYIKLSFGLLHRAVAEHFVPNPDNKPCVDHIDGNIHNNRADNLRWVTYKENTHNPISRQRFFDAIGREDYRKQISERQLIRYKDPEEHIKTSIAVKKAMYRPDVQAKIRKVKSKL